MKLLTAGRQSHFTVIQNTADIFVGGIIKKHHDASFLIFIISLINFFIITKRIYVIIAVDEVCKCLTVLRKYRSSLKNRI